MLRVIANSLPSQKPPVFEGIPFIGGVLKFVQVSYTNWPVRHFDLLYRSCAALATVKMPLGWLGGGSPCVVVHQGPKQLLEQGYKKYGEVFTVPVLNKKITFLIGTDVTPFFFKATDEEMSQQEVKHAIM